MITLAKMTAAHVKIYLKQQIYTTKMAFISHLCLDGFSYCYSK